MDRKKPPQLFSETATPKLRASPPRANPKLIQEPKFENTSGQREKPDPIFNPVGEAGWYLELERTERGLSLATCAAETGIHISQIEAIEMGDLTRMPERMEALELVAIYAHFLGFAPEPLIEHYAAHLPAETLTAQPKRRHPADPAPLSSARILPFGGRIAPRFDFSAIKVPALSSVRPNGIVAAVAGFFMIFGAGTYYINNALNAPAVDADLSAQIIKADPMPTATTGPDEAIASVIEAPITAPIAQIPNAQAVVQDDPDAIGNFIEQLEEPAVAGGAKKKDVIAEKQSTKKKGKKNKIELDPATGEQAAADPMSTGTIYGDGNLPSRITLTAKAPVWMSIDDAKGNSLITRMLNPGESYRVPDSPGLVVLTRDGGRLAFSIDGVEKGLIGLPGEIITGNPLDVEELLKKG